MVSGMPFKEADQDSYEELMRMEDKEIKFWDKVNKIPNNMEKDVWEELRADYHERMRIAKEEGVKYEKETLDDIFKHLEVKDLNAVKTTGELHVDVFLICGMSVDGSGMLISRKWNEPLCHVSEIFKYEKEAIERDKYYKMVNNGNDDDRYEQWLDYIAECKVLTGDTSSIIPTEIVETDLDQISELLKEKASKVVIEKPVEKKKRIMSENEEDDEDDDLEEDEDGNIVRNDETLFLDDEFDDTYAEIPEEYLETLASVNGMDNEPELQKEEEPEDEWGF